MTHCLPDAWIKLVVAIAIAAGVVACVHDVYTRFPAELGADVGAIELAFSAPASSVSVAVNGIMVVRDVRTESVTITDVSIGFAELAIVAGAGEKQMRVWVES